MRDIKLPFKNKYFKVTLLYSGSGGSGNISLYNKLILPETAYIDTGLKDNETTFFKIRFIPVSLKNSYQNYIASKLDNFTFAYYSGNNNYLRVWEHQIATNINCPFGVEKDYECNARDNGYSFLGNSGENIFINTNSNLNRIGNQELLSVDFETNGILYTFVPAMNNNNEVGIYDTSNNIFIAAQGEGAYCTNE